MYFINKKIVKSIANEIYRIADFGQDKATDYYVIYDDDNGNTIAFSAYKNKADLVNKYDFYTIDFINDLDNNETHYYYFTTTLNRRELADKLLEVIEVYRKELIV